MACSAAIRSSTEPVGSAVTSGGSRRSWRGGVLKRSWRSRPADLAPAALALLALAAGAGCAAASCPAVALGTGIRLDATGWAHGEPLTATICLNGTCGPAAAERPTTPDAVFLYTGLPTGPATVEVRLTTTSGRTLDVSTTAPVRQVTLEGSGCGSTPEIDLAVERNGALTTGKQRTLGGPPTQRSTPTSVTPPTGLPTP